MINKDYLMRIVDQLAKVITKVLYLMDQKQFPEAHKELDAIGTKITGFPWNSYKSMTAGSMQELLSMGDKFDIDRAALVVNLLTLEADLALDEGNDPESTAHRINALLLCLEIHRESPHEENLKIAKELLYTIENSDMPVDLNMIGEIKAELGIELDA